MNNWIFVIKDDESVFKKRINGKTWPIFAATKFQTFLEIGDNVIFYQAGLSGQKFLGTAMIKSKIKKIPGKIDSYVEIDHVKIWEKYPSIRGLISDLDLIKNKTHWGLNLQGGILQLNEKDHSLFWFIRIFFLIFYLLWISL